MKVGDKVKVNGFDGFYSTYEEWAIAVGADKWVRLKRPECMEFTIKAVRKHLIDSETLYLLSNDEGDFIFCNRYGEITLSDLKPKRTLTEYEKVTESIFDLRDEFERGELYMKLGGELLPVPNETQLSMLLDHRQCYRKIEKDIDWRDEAHEYLGGTEFHWSTPIAEVINDESNCFLELCRVALRANGEIE